MQIGVSVVAVVVKTERLALTVVVILCQCRMYGLDSFGFGKGPMARYFKHCNEPSGFVKCREFLDWWSNLLTYLLTYLLTPCIRVLLEKPVFSYSRNSPHFTETEGSLPHSQLPASFPYPEPARSSP